MPESEIIRPPVAVRPLVSFLVLDYKKEQVTRDCLESIKNNAQFPREVIYLDNGSQEDYCWDFYKSGLCDILISKKQGDGGGFGQTDLIRYCRTPYFFFVQNDQKLQFILNQQVIDEFIDLLEKENYQCVDCNGDQSGGGVWTDRAHFMKTEIFNGLGPFPNGGPGRDEIPWNEEYLQKKFKELDYKIFHIRARLFSDEGKWSVRSSGDGIFEHRCDTKLLIVSKIPTYFDAVYPPLNEEEKAEILAGKWPVEGKIPIAWKPHSFKHWKD